MFFIISNSVFCNYFLFLCPFIMFWFFLILFLVHFLTSSFLSLCLRCTVFLPPLSVPYINLLRFKIYCLLFWAFCLWSLYGCYNDSFCISSRLTTLCRKVNKNISIVLLWIDIPKFTQIHIQKLPSMVCL